MMKFFLPVLIILFSFSTSAHEQLDSLDLYEKISNSTIRINIWKDYKTENQNVYGGGTGVVINEINDLYFIVTNAHVVLESFCFNEYSDGCVDKNYNDKYSIVIDHPSHDDEIEISYDNIMHWYEYDIAVIAIDLSNYQEKFIPIEIGGAWHPLMKIYGAGFPMVLGNYNKNYADMIFCSGVVNQMFTDEVALQQLYN